MTELRRTILVAMSLLSIHVPEARRRVAFWPLRAVSVAIMVLMGISLVPSDAAYAKIERTLSIAAPLGAASRHLRTIPSTASSIILEGVQDRGLEVEGVDVNLNYAVHPGERVEEHTFYSNVLGEDRTYRVYLPPGYEDSRRSYPTLYLLHGMSQGQQWWTEVARVDRIATSMIDAGKIRPAIIVMPNGNRVERDISTTSLYDDHCATGLDAVGRALKTLGDRFQGLRIYKISCEGNFDAFISRELVSEIDSAYRTDGERYVGGFSIGARGALQLALGNPDVFAGAFGLSGNYDYLRGELRAGRSNPPDGMKLFVGAGVSDQRGVYGDLNTLLFHRQMASSGVAHLYCTYPGTHSDVTWVSTMPLALEFLLSDGFDASERDRETYVDGTG